MTARKGCLRKLKKELAAFLKDPPPYIPLVHVNESNMLDWHFLLEGPPDTPYEGGWYIARLRYPPDYPFSPPAILMLSPSGRFKTNTRLCLSISDFHPESWNPAWSVSMVMIGLLSFMVENTQTTGSLETSDDEKRAFARASLSVIQSNPQFSAMFPELPLLVQAQREQREQKEKEKEGGQKEGGEGDEEKKKGEPEEEKEREAGKGGSGEEENGGDREVNAAVAAKGYAGAPAAADAPAAAAAEGNLPTPSPTDSVAGSLPPSSILHRLSHAEARLLGRAREELVVNGREEEEGCEASAASHRDGIPGGGEGSNSGGSGSRGLEGGDPEGALEEVEEMLRESEGGEGRGEGGVECGEGREEDNQGSALQEWRNRLLMCKAEALVVMGDFDKALSVLSSLHHHLHLSLTLTHTPSSSSSSAAAPTRTSTSSSLTPADQSVEGGDVEGSNGEDSSRGPWVAGAVSWLRPQVTLAEVESFQVRVEGAGRHRARGAEQYKKQSFAAAVRAFSTAKSFLLSCAAIHFNLAAALAALARHEEVVAACDEALALIATHSKARKRRADSLAALGRHGEAATEYLVLLQLQPGESKWGKMAEDQRKKAVVVPASSSS
ncbi:hypothetical protein CLOM_g22101 [Closterium sp. NIES-68]|nr:hypothetical protein CLOM_g22101 [Closterium sp. NIES-68]GJP74444.1 hypothetical protein CLOP_g5024 [Closterium sp. NIES-67]